ncbi:MAG: hypothetical protein M0C28_31060 [Candidatus Moduliflexus flocculans]|nr:hypothetical protein [Candidatus Moduliflexus flocculans]
MTDAPWLERPDGFSLALNYVPLLHLAAGIALAVAVFSATTTRLACLALWIYVLPPVVSRLTLAAFGRPAGRATLDTRNYRVWWFLTQWQMVFNPIALARGTSASGAWAVPAVDRPHGVVGSASSPT